ncbi:MAG: hypothetical protein GQ540_10215 [Lutibacter sp.]|uniref:hypothetical protein n=1 Tax=Lutibacter sp. TaxID=1925666 RepID=UPI001A00D61E|nr:hypothetical protein [Lutibacter sp.]NOR28885.1 hypothetical protein [Lutibacter sp.]
MKRKVIDYSIYLVFIFGLLGAGNLAYHEFLKIGTCPKLGIIPACYIIFSCLLIPFIAHILTKGKVIYFVFTGTALLIATYATIGQLFGNVQCPKTEHGFPMCYISFIIFASLISLKWILIKKK